MPGEASYLLVEGSDNGNMVSGAGKSEVRAYTTSTEKRENVTQMLFSC